MDKKIQEEVSKLIKKEAEDYRLELEENEKSYQRVLSAWIETIKKEPNLGNKKVELGFYGENSYRNCRCRRYQCDCNPVPSIEFVKEFLSDYFQREVKEFVRNVRVESDRDCYGCDYYYDCWVVFGLSYEEKVAEAEEEIRKCKSKLKKLRTSK